MEWHQAKIFCALAAFVAIHSFGDCSTILIDEKAAANQKLHFLVVVQKLTSSGAAVRNCTGALLSAQHVVTVGDCVDITNVKNVNVYTGNAAMWTNAFRGDKHPAKTIQRHPKFANVNGRTTSQAVYDVAVIHLEKPVALGTQASIITLTSSQAEPKATSSINVAGFNINDWGETTDPGDPPALRMKRGQILSREDCGKKMFAQITPQEFCVTNGPDNGISGSPAFVGNVLYGLMSWGTKVFVDLAEPTINSFVRKNLQT